MQSTLLIRTCAAPAPFDSRSHLDILSAKKIQDRLPSGFQYMYLAIISTILYVSWYHTYNAYPSWYHVLGAAITISTL